MNKQDVLCMLPDCNGPYYAGRPEPQSGIPEWRNGALELAGTFTAKHLRAFLWFYDNPGSEWELKTTMVDGRIAGCPVADLERDAAGAHALVAALDECYVEMQDDDSNHRALIIANAKWIEKRADQILREWGIEP